MENVLTLDSQGVRKNVLNRFVISRSRVQIPPPGPVNIRKL